MVIRANTVWYISSAIKLSSKHTYSRRKEKTSSRKGNDAHRRAIIESQKNGNIDFSDA